MAARSTRPISGRSRRRPRARDRGTTTSHWPPLRPRRRSGRSTRADAPSRRPDETRTFRMPLSRRTLLSAAAASAAVPVLRARAQSPVIKIGVLNDQSGPYTNTGGMTSVVCARQAVEDFGAATKGLNVEIITADHQNKPDLAVSIARQWFDRDGVDMLLDVPTSSVALA